MIAVLGLAACGMEFTEKNNSSLGDDDYFEEPISDRSKRFTPALETSNLFVERFSDGQLSEARELFDEGLRDAVTLEDLASLHSQVLTNFGEFVEFKPMQWGFTSLREENQKVVYSTKIVIHEDSGAFYILRFQENSGYKTISGLHIQPRVGNQAIIETVDMLLSQ